MTGNLSIKTALQNGRTALCDRSFSAPLKIAKPFYHDDGYTEIMMMCAGPGMLAGDTYTLCFDLGEDTKTMITGQSSQKLYNTGDGAAEQFLQMRVGANASACYLPRPVIPFAGSVFHARTQIELAPSSKLFYADMLACGRPGMGERFAFSAFTSRVVISVDGRAVLLDQNRLLPGEAALAGTGFFEGYSLTGFLYYYGYGAVCPPPWNGIEAAVSKAHEGYFVRFFGNSADNMYEFAKHCFQCISTY